MAQGGSPLAGLARLLVVRKGRKGHRFNSDDPVTKELTGAAPSAHHRVDVEGRDAVGAHSHRDAMRVRDDAERMPINSHASGNGWSSAAARRRRDQSHGNRR